MYSIGFALLLIAGTLQAAVKPLPEGDAVQFSLTDNHYRSVAVSGDFNGWDKQGQPLRLDGNTWHSFLDLPPEVYEYRVIIDGVWQPDPENPFRTTNRYNDENSAFTLTASGEVLYAIAPDRIDRSHNGSRSHGTLYLNILWHQHQPLYLDPEKDQLQGPWVRTHGTKDYYDMTSILADYPDVHFSVNLTPSMLYQLDEYYVQRIKPFLDHKKKQVRRRPFSKKWHGKTDPWVDLLLKPTEKFDEIDDGYLYTNSWNCLSIADPLLEKIPRYRALKKKPFEQYTDQDKRDLKGLFFLGYFDHEFFRGPQILAGGYRLDLSDLATLNAADEVILTRPFTEDDCGRILYETIMILDAIVPVHKQLMYDPAKHTGQLEVTTTPFYHPILPLIIDTDLARTAMPDATLPTRYQQKDDARAQVTKSVEFYRRLFGRDPLGMWPGEGAVCEEMVPILAEHNFLWVASGDGVLANSTPSGQPVNRMYRVDADTRVGHSDGSVAAVFRESFLSDLIGFRYKTWQAKEAVDDFVSRVSAYAPADPGEECLLTVILDGENAWEWYTEEYDGRGFIVELYERLTELSQSGEVVTVTPTEYLQGNPARGIAPHPVEQLPELEPLWPGSWINGNYDTWIGEEEENRAWEYLRQTRSDLAVTAAAPPDYTRIPKKLTERRKNELHAWEALYAAEGSDWFWWFGADQTAGEGDEQFERGFLTHLRNVYRYLQLAGYDVQTPDFKPVLNASVSRSGQGVMARSEVDVLLQCRIDAKVPDAVYVVGGVPNLGNWTPNTIPMYDDGTHGDRVADDNIWSLEVRLPEGETIQYKYTNSGEPGVWVNSEEFSGSNRKVEVRRGVVVLDEFGKLEK